jgi:hypothetical protein
MSATRSNSHSSRKPLSAYAKLRKQRYDKQYHLDIAVFGFSRWSERMRETGRVDDDGCNTQRRDTKGKFSTGYVTPLRTAKEEINDFLNDLTGVPSTVRFCLICTEPQRSCRCRDILGLNCTTEQCLILINRFEPRYHLAYRDLEEGPNVDVAALRDRLKNHVI